MSSISANLVNPIGGTQCLQGICSYTSISAYGLNCNYSSTNNTLICYYNGRQVLNANNISCQSSTVPSGYVCIPQRNNNSITFISASINNSENFVCNVLNGIIDCNVVGNSSTGNNNQNGINVFCGGANVNVGGTARRATSFTNTNFNARNSNLPYATPLSASFSPLSSPYATPLSSPYATPLSSPYPIPLGAPFSPLSSPYATPLSSPYPIPLGAPGYVPLSTGGFITPLLGGCNGGQAVRQVQQPSNNIATSNDIIINNDVPQPTPSRAQSAQSQTFLISSPPPNIYINQLGYPQTPQCGYN